MDKIKSYLQFKKEVLKKPSFWANQIVDMAIVILLFGWLLGYVPPLYVVFVIGLYIGVKIVLTVKRSLETAIKEVNKAKTKRR